MRRTLAAGRTPIMATTRDELSDSLHRLSNYVETQLCDVLCELVRDGRAVAVTDLAWQGSRFIKCCREIRDGEEGGEE
jgi:hypothetical protein